MPASANWPERTLISPILTVPCALVDETPSSSATAQPKPTRIRFIIILPVLAAEQLQKIVLMKACAVEKVRRPRAVGTAPPSALTCPPVIAGHSASEDARERAHDATRTMATGTRADEFTRMRHRRSTSRLTPAKDLVPSGMRFPNRCG